MPCVPLQDGEEDDIQGRVGGVQDLPPYVALQVIHPATPPFTCLEDVLSLLLGELQPHVEQSLLQLLVEWDLLSGHGAGDEPHRQLGVVWEVVIQEVKPNITNCY